MNTHDDHPSVIHPALSGLSSSRGKQGKIVSAEAAIQLIRDGDTGGFAGIGFPEGIAVAVEEYFLQTGKPRDLTLVYAARKPRTITTVGIGTFVDPENGGGKINEMTTEDLVERIVFDGNAIAPYTDMVKKLVDDLYATVTRYTTSAFIRKKLGDEPAKRDVSPHIYKSSGEAIDQLNKIK